MAGSGDSEDGRRSPMPLRLLHEADRAWQHSGPTRRALRAFGVRAGQLRRMPAVEHTWTDGRLFLKPVGCIPEHAWVSEVHANWNQLLVRALLYRLGPTGIFAMEPAQGASGHSR